MQILLINKNPIVSKLFALSAKSIEGVEMDEVEDIQNLPHDSYDILFIDDGDSLDEELEECIYSIDAKLKILFVAEDNRDIDGVDEIIKKPFLPSTIVSKIQSQHSKEIERSPIEKAELTRDRIAKDDSLVLDKKEIDVIKNLLLESEEHTTNEQEEMVQRDSADTKEKLEEQLLEALINMKPKMIKRLLKGAEINISIKFPKEESQ